MRSEVTLSVRNQVLHSAGIVGGMPRIEMQVGFENHHVGRTDRSDVNTCGLLNAIHASLGPEVCQLVHDPELYPAMSRCLPPHQKLRILD